MFNIYWHIAMSIHLYHHIINPSSFLTMFHKKHFKTTISNAKGNIIFIFIFWGKLNPWILLYIAKRICRKTLKNFDLIDFKIISFKVKR